VSSTSLATSKQSGLYIMLHHNGVKPLLGARGYSSGFSASQPSMSGPNVLLGNPSGYNNAPTPSPLLTGSQQLSQPSGLCGGYGKSSHNTSLLPHSQQVGRQYTESGAKHRYPLMVAATRQGDWKNGEQGKNGMESSSLLSA
jgi:hypothetical protein